MFALLWASVGVALRPASHALGICVTVGWIDGPQWVSHTASALIRQEGEQLVQFVRQVSQCTLGLALREAQLHMSRSNRISKGRQDHRLGCCSTQAWTSKHTPASFNEICTVWLFIQGSQCPCPHTPITHVHRSTHACSTLCAARCWADLLAAKHAQEQQQGFHSQQTCVKCAGHTSDSIAAIRSQ